MAEAVGRAGTEPGGEPGTITLSNTGPGDAIRSVSFDIDGRRIAALHRPALAGSGGGDAPRDALRDAPRLLCLHGWLDNANSFVPLMPHLRHAEIVAIDLPGHGHSDPLEAGYSLTETTYRVRRVMQALGWERCHLVGHSLGGCAAPMLAVAAPDAITSLIMIEASGALSEESHAFPARLARALSERLDLARFASRTFSDPAEAIAARLRAARMSEPAARLIIERQLRAVDGGWQWRFDPLLRVTSPQYQSEAQVHAVLTAIDCPVLTIIATDGFLSARAEQSEARLACLSRHHSVTLPGHHHLHMDTPEPVAAAINRFLTVSGSTLHAH